MKDTFVDVEAKRAARDKRKGRARDYKQIRRLQRKCFWTWPWGHEYVTKDGATRCVGCRKYQTYSEW